MKRKIKVGLWDQTLRGLNAIEVVDDELVDLINVMNLYSKEENYKRAQEAKEMIIKELQKPRPDIHSEFDLARTNCNTLMAVHDKLRENIIRLDWVKMLLSEYLLLLEFAHGNLKGLKIKTPTRVREMVAKCMALLNIEPQQGRGRGAPNRVFMDLLFKYNERLAVDDLLRRARSKMWHAVEHGRGIEEVRAEFKNLNKVKKRLDLE